MNKRSMKTVEEYLEDGCVFVEGDYCIDYDLCIWNGGDFTPLIKIGNTDWNEDEVTKFTWRNSTGTTPTYTNLVEVKQRNGTVYVDYVKNIDFTLELSDDDVVQWKPYIECELDFCHTTFFTTNTLKWIDSDSETQTILTYTYNRGE